jgi:hypothetical protein
MKQTKLTPQPTGLVLFSMGWYGKYALPADAAAIMLKTLIESGAVKIDTESISHSGTSTTVTTPKKMDWSIEPFDAACYLSDCPMDGDDRKAYLDWIKSRSGLAGRLSIASYAEYLETLKGD